MKTLVLVLTFAAGAAAQDATASDSRWQGWLGCWRLMGAEAELSPVLCIVPTTTESAVDFVTLSASKEASRVRVDASGERRPVRVDGCEGWETASWSSDNRRAFTRSDVTCAGGLKRASTGVLAISRSGDLLDVSSVSAGGGTGTRVSRFREAGVPANVSPEIAAALSGREMAVSAARVAAGANLTPANVVEASRSVDAPTLEAFLVELGQSFPLSARELVSLANAGVPGSVTDVMIAVSNPRRFALDRRSGEARFVVDSTPGGVATSRRRCSTLDWAYDPWALSPYWGYGMYGSSNCGFGRYGYNAFGYDHLGYGNYYWNRPTYVVVVKAPEQKGQAVKGSGYTRAGGSSTTSSGSSGTSSSGSSGQSRSSGRTAKARP